MTTLVAKSILRLFVASSLLLILASCGNEEDELLNGEEGEASGESADATAETTETPEEPKLKKQVTSLEYGNATTYGHSGQKSFDDDDRFGTEGTTSASETEEETPAAQEQATTPAASGLASGTVLQTWNYIKNRSSTGKTICEAPHARVNECETKAVRFTSPGGFSGTAKCLCQ